MRDRPEPPRRLQGRPPTRSPSCPCHRTSESGRWRPRTCPSLSPAPPGRGGRAGSRRKPRGSEGMGLDCGSPSGRHCDQDPRRGVRLQPASEHPFTGRPPRLRARSRWGRVQAPQPRVRPGTDFEDTESVAPNIYGARSCDPRVAWSPPGAPTWHLALKPQVPGQGNTRSTCQRMHQQGSGVTVTRPQ